jgi:hypothetical protein
MIKCQNVVEVKKGRELAVVQRKRENKAKSKMKYIHIFTTYHGKCNTQK